MSDHDDKPPHREPVRRRYRGGPLTAREAKEAIRELLERWDSKTEPERQPGEDDPEAA